MITYKRLAEEKRTSRRTIADALEVLREAAEFADHDQAVVNVGLMKLPSEHVIGIVQVFFQRTPDITYIVSLPTSALFRAIREGSTQRKKFDISLLDEATVGGNGQVSLTNGSQWRAVEVMPARLPTHPSQLHWRIIHATINAVDAKKRCYWQLPDKLPPQFRGEPEHRISCDLQEAIFEQKFVNCRALVGLETPPLKELIYRLGNIDPSLKRISGQAVSDVLRKFGVRIPTPRPRRRAGQH